MKSKRLGKLDYNLEPLIEEVSGLAPDAYSSAYAEYSIGHWDTATLWNDPKGPTDGTVVEHDNIAEPTLAGQQTPAINAFVKEAFLGESLRAVRLFRARSGAIIIPHRDYLEHPSGFCRVHVPLITTSAARNSENDTVYHMAVGEVWFVDGSQAHSGGVLSGESRIHLVMDFDFQHTSDPAGAVTAELHESNAAAIVERPPLDPDLLAGLYRFAPALRLAMWPTAVQMLARLHLVYDADVRALYDWLDELAQHSGRPELVSEAARMRRYFLTDGPSATASFAATWPKLPVEASL